MPQLHILHTCLHQKSRKPIIEFCIHILIGLTGKKYDTLIGCTHHSIYLVVLLAIECNLNNNVKYQIQDHRFDYPREYSLCHRQQNA